MAKRSRAKLETVQLILPEELPFEKGTGLSRQDACSRLTFQLLIERVLPGYTLRETLEEEDWVFEVQDED